jgi:hypothetical protein
MNKAKAKYETLNKSEDVTQIIHEENGYESSPMKYSKVI